MHAGQASANKGVATLCPYKLLKAAEWEMKIGYREVCLVHNQSGETVCRVSGKTPALPQPDIKGDVATAVIRFFPQLKGI